MAGGAAASCSRGGDVAQGHQVLLRVVGAPGRTAGGDDYAHRVWQLWSGRGDDALRVQLRTFQPDCVSGCRRRPGRHLHPAGREQLSVYGDGPKHGRFLRFLRGHQGCEQSGGIGLRRFHDTGWPAPNAHSYADTHPNAHADTHPNAHADTHPNAHADTHAHANPYPNTHANPYPNAATNPDPNAATNPDPNAATNPDPNAATNPDPNAATNTHAHADTLGSGTGRGGKHARAGDHPGGCRGSPSYDWRRGVCP